MNKISPIPQGAAGQLPAGAAGVLEKLDGGSTIASCYAPSHGNSVVWKFTNGLPDEHFRLKLTSANQAPNWTTQPGVVSVSNSTFPANASPPGNWSGNNLFATTLGSTHEHKLLVLHFVSSNNHVWGTTHSTLNQLTAGNTYTFFKVSSIHDAFRKVTDS